MALLRVIHGPSGVSSLINARHVLSGKKIRIISPWAVTLRVSISAVSLEKSREKERKKESKGRKKEKIEFRSSTFQ